MTQAVVVTVTRGRLSFVVVVDGVVVDEHGREFIVSALDAMHQLPVFSSLLSAGAVKGQKQAFKLSYLETG